jgi:tetratricopeptide (TPR) repeat protein
VARNEAMPPPGGGASPNSGPMTEAMAAAIERMDWAEVRRIVDATQNSAVINWRQKALIASNATDWLAVLRAEPGVLGEVGVATVEDLPGPLIRLSIQARHRLELFEEARDLSRKIRQRMPNRPEWLRREADALFRLGDEEAALALALEAWQQRLEFAPQLMARSLVELKQFQSCKEYLEEASVALGDPEPLELTRAWLTYAEGLDDHDAIESHLNRIRGAISDEEYWSQMSETKANKFDYVAMFEMFDMVARWRELTEHDRLYRRAAPAILQSHFRLFADWSKIKPQVWDLAGRSLEPSQATAISTLLLQAGEYQIARDLVGRSLDSFPSSQSLWRRHLHILSLIGAVEELNAARKEMRTRFPRDSYLATMSIAEPRSWDDAEIPELLEHNLARKNKDKLGKFVASVTEADLSVDQLRTLREVTANITPVVAAQFDLMLAAAGDVSLLDRAVSTPVNFKKFRRTRSEIIEIVRKLTVDLPAQEPNSLPVLYGMADCLRLTGQMRTNERTPALYTRESYLDAARLAAVIIRRISDRLSTSIIRLGDGEGHFLEGPESIEGYRQADRAQIQNIWWGSTRMEGEQLDGIIADFRRAVASCDVLAILPPWRFIAEIHKPGYTPVHRGIHSSIFHVAGMTHQSLITSMHFPNDFHKWGLWDEIFAACDGVSYISCHDLGPFLLENFGLKTYTAIRIPGERQFTSLFTDSNKVDEGPTLLDQHNEVIDQLSPMKGEVYLVAAGFLGKIYCDVIRRRGGVAIDIGSLADYWMGYATRRYRLEDEGHTGVLNVYVEENALKDRPAPERIVGASTFVRSSANCRYNIYGLLSPKPDEKPEGLAHSILAIGHPRCGGRFLAGLLGQHGLQVGHETLLRHGIVSWTHAVRDMHVPNGENATMASFAHTIAYGRDPASAIPSVVLENGKGKSLYFRRQHILRQTGVDLAQYGTPLERAVASFVYWYDIIFSQSPQHLVPIERAADMIDGLVLGLSMQDGAESLEMAEVHADELHETTKPSFTRRDYSRLSAELKDRLETFCSAFGYDVPW